MRKNIRLVIDAWKAGNYANGDTCHTDGKTVWSYNLPIAHRNDQGQVFIIPRKSTRTTNMQITACQTACSEWDGDKWHQGYFEVNDIFDPDVELVNHDIKMLAAGG